VAKANKQTVSEWMRSVLNEASKPHATFQTEVR
jgi:hypothetical protein